MPGREEVDGAVAAGMGPNLDVADGLAVLAATAEFPASDARFLSAALLVKFYALLPPGAACGVGLAVIAVRPGRADLERDVWNCRVAFAIVVLVPATS